MIFFRFPRAGLPGFVQGHLAEHVRCLEHSFEVTVVDSDCDYDEVCDRVRPDIALFESGVYAGPRRITNTHTHPEIPKIGLLNSDAYCVTRSVFVSDMANWGVDTFFTISVSMAEYFPEIADRLFVWPNFADTDVYRDYGARDRFPILMTGSRAVHYPWRNAVNAALENRFPVMRTPHGGWFDAKAASGMVIGEQYARLLNMALVVPTCGTVAKDVVRKHFEIPAAAACLVAERTPALESAGFEDMKNCVFADETDVVERVGHLLADPGELERIVAAGHDLVRSRHGIQHRTQMRQWLELGRGLQPGQRVVQRNPFEDLVVEGPGSAGNRHVVVGGRDRGDLAAAHEAYRAGRLHEAETLYLRCLNYHFMPEPALGLALTHLRLGDADTAVRWIGQPIRRVLHDHGAPEPDPVEWATLVRAELCAGRLGVAAEHAARYPGLRHPELDRARAVLTLLTGDDVPVREAPPRPSVHVLPVASDEQWRLELATMLAACGQAEPAGRVSGTASATAVPAPHTRRVGRVATVADARAVATERLTGSLPARVGRRLRHEVRTRRAQPRSKVLGELERLVATADAGTAVLLGVRPGDPVAEAALDGLRRNPRDPAVVRLGDPRVERLAPDQLQYGGGSPGQAPAVLAGLLARDAILVIGPQVRVDLAVDFLAGCVLVVVTDPRSPSVAGLRADLADDERWVTAGLGGPAEGDFQAFTRSG